MARVVAFMAAMILSVSAGAADILTKLSNDDKLSELVLEQAQLWTDGNISTGTSTVVSGTIAAGVPQADDAWKKLATDIFADRFKRYVGEELPADAKLRVSSKAFEKKHIQAVVDALVEANAYNDENPDIQKSLTDEVTKLVGAVGSEKELHFMAIKTRLEDEASGEKRNIRIHAFSNTTTGKTIVIFTIEGTM